METSAATGNFEDKRIGRRGKYGDQRGQRDTHGVRVTRAAESEVESEVTSEARYKFGFSPG